MRAKYVKRNYLYTTILSLNSVDHKMFYIYHKFTSYYYTLFEETKKNKIQNKYKYLCYENSGL